MNSFFGSSQNTKTEKHTRTGRSNSKERHFSNRKEERFLDDGFNEPERESRETEDFHSAQSIASSAKPTKMFMYVKERNWTGVVRRCMGDDKREAATWIVDKNIDGSMRWKCLPLHQACESKAPSEAVKALIAAYPEAVAKKDSGGDMPLHLACRERASKSVIAALLLAAPEAAKVPDDEGRLPLHLACRQGGGVEIVDNLIVCHYRAVRTPDSYSLLPIHWACAQNATPDVIESLLRAYPDSVDVKDNWGRTPLSLAKASTNPKKDEIMESLSKDPAFWMSSHQNTINSLRSNIEVNTAKEKEVLKKTRSLEEKLVEVTQASNTAAATFNELRTELEQENENLKTEIGHLTSINRTQSHKFEKLMDENTALARQVNSLKSRLNETAAIYREIEEQRMRLLKVTGSMEKSLKKAAQIANEK